jgi:hypothetical protein
MKLHNIIIAGVLAIATSACNDFIDVAPTGVIDGDLAYTDPEAMVTAAYASLGDCWYDCPINLWTYGDLGSDDCLKGGSGTTDTGYHPMEIWSTMTSTPGEFDALWYNIYRSISRCNRALVALEENGKSELGEATTTQRSAKSHGLTKTY